MRKGVEGDGLAIGRGGGKGERYGTYEVRVKERAGEGEEA